MVASVIPASRLSTLEGSKPSEAHVNEANKVAVTKPRRPPRTLSQARTSRSHFVSNSRHMAVWAGGQAAWSVWEITRRRALPLPGWRR